MENNKNSNKKNVKKSIEKKVITTKQMVIRRLIFIVIFLILASVVTTYLIINKNSNSKELHNENKPLQDVDNKENKKNKNKSLIDLKTDTYNMNNLDIVLYKEKYQDIDINYYQIDGLLDNGIEVSINYSLKHDVEETVDKILNDSKITKDSIIVTPFLNSNFANTLSIYYNVLASNYSKELETYEYFVEEFVVENFDLTTGNKIKMNDIFTEGTEAKEIFDSNFYNEIIPNYTTQEMNEDDWYVRVTDYKDIEEEIFYLINSFNNKRNINFVFDEKGITLLDYWANLYYEDFLDNVNIYNKYKTDKSIFDGNYNRLNEIPVLAKRADFEYQIIDQGENYYIDISLDNIDEQEDRNEIVYNSVINYIQSEVALIKEAASKMPNKFLIANYSLMLVPNSYEEGVLKSNDTFICYFNKLNYETTKSMFNSKIYNKIIDVFRFIPKVETGEAYLYDNLFLYHVFEDEDDYSDIESSYEELYLDKTGTIYKTEEELLNSINWNVDD